MDPLSPGAVKSLLLRHDFKIKKSLGQNFLIDGNIINKIANAADLNSGDVVVEIGPGLGSLTRVLAGQSKHVVAVEIDTRLVPILEETLSGFDNISLEVADALKTDFNRLVARHVPEHRGSYKVVANLPYYITSPLVMHLLENSFNISHMVLMVQQEVAERLAAVPGTKDYGAITVAARFYAQVTTAFVVPGSVFLPRPKVDSAVLSLAVREQPEVAVDDKAVFFSIVRAAFQQRRKTLLNALAAGQQQMNKQDLSKLLQSVGIDGARRGETLSLQEFALLSNAFAKI